MVCCGLICRRSAAAYAHVRGPDASMPPRHARRAQTREAREGRGGYSPPGLLRSLPSAARKCPSEGEPHAPADQDGISRRSTTAGPSRTDAPPASALWSHPPPARVLTRGEDTAEPPDAIQLPPTPADMRVFGDAQGPARSLSGRPRVTKCVPWPPTRVASAAGPGRLAAHHPFYPGPVRVSRTTGAARP